MTQPFLIAHDYQISNYLNTCFVLYAFTPNMAMVYLTKLAGVVVTRSPLTATTGFNIGM